MFADPSARALILRALLYPVVGAGVALLLGEPWWYGALIGLGPTVVWVLPELYRRLRTPDDGVG